jgi:hypothetical protein
VLEVGSASRVPTSRNYTLVNPQVGSPRDLGMRHSCKCHVVENFWLKKGGFLLVGVLIEEDDEAIVALVLSM